MIKYTDRSFHQLINENDFTKFLDEHVDKKHISTTLKEWEKSHGFIRLPFNMDDELEKINRYIDSLPKEIDTFVLIGIGGSSLGPLTIYESLKYKISGKRFICLDNVDPVKMNECLETINPKHCVFNIISKSGTTAETMANYFVLYNRVKDQLDDISKHFVFTTDPKTGILNEIAEVENIQCFSIPENVGGRFSVLTPVGMLMASFLGLDSKAILTGAQDLYPKIYSENLQENTMLNYAIQNYYLYLAHKVNIAVMMPYNSKLKEFTNWFKQLWAESLGKENDIHGDIITVGQTPLSSIGATDQHSLVQLFAEGPNDKVITFIKTEHFPNDYKIENPFHFIKGLEIYNQINMSELLNYELDATQFALTKFKKFNCQLSIEQLDEYALGQLFYFFEIATAISGILYSINPFDQPGVESGKIATKALLGDPKYSSLKDEILSQK